ncbi:MAG TPA: primosomal protein N' [Solirubrobacteraceae bacterium]|nr:primosomal protein N' [Solirubrobacteraceae bacterium]
MPAPPGTLEIAKVEPLTTARALRGPFDYRLPPDLEGGAVGVGSMLVVPFGRREVLGVVTGLCERSEVAEEKLLAPLRALELGVPVDLVALAEWLAAEYCSTLARALRLVLPAGATGKGPAGLGVRKRRSRAVARPRHEPVGRPHAAPPALTDDQRRALRAIEQRLDRAGRPAGDAAAASRDQPPALLLHGITGSGKTEVYLRAAAGTLERGMGAIVLVPEIALTPQIVGRFVERFGDTVAVLHSRLTPAQRRQEWRRLRTGEARVCVGPRSAVFAPIERLGLIVVDEEHDSSYKHEGDPRYDAREVAAKRAALQGALLLLGSATPRPESVHAVARVRLPRRVDDRPLPPVQLLDMREQRYGLHPGTVQALAQVRSVAAKAIVLLNRRGWSNFLSCRSCGRVWSCPHCDVALVFHRAESQVRCHHCDHCERAPERCRCGSTAVARHGAGTERLQHELQLTLGDDERFPIFRLDADALPASSADGVGALLRRFEAAPAGALIGTQMVAKGHDFADVRLGVVVDADATLRFPDFRAEERTFALIAQLAGRVGRGGEGRVLVQTLDPAARAIAHAARHDSEGFLLDELKRREALRYPPYAHLIRVVCAAAEADRAQTAASAVREALRAGSGVARLAPEQATVLGPATLFRLRGHERRMLLVKANDRGAAVRGVGAAVQRAAGARAHAGVSFSVDVDPQ